MAGGRSCPVTNRDCDDRQWTTNSLQCQGVCSLSKFGFTLSLEVALTTPPQDQTTRTAVANYFPLSCEHHAGYQLQLLSNQQHLQVDDDNITRLHRLLLDQNWKITDTRSTAALEPTEVRAARILHSILGIIPLCLVNYQPQNIIFFAGFNFKRLRFYLEDFNR